MTTAFVMQRGMRMPRKDFYRTEMNPKTGLFFFIFLP
jgi:hypothetical protein